MSNPNIIPWTDQNVETLRKLWKEGHSAAVIAGTLGTPNGRLAVIGKAKRLQLGPHPNSVPYAKATEAARKMKEKAAAKMRQRREEEGIMSRAQVGGIVHRRKPPKPPVVIEKVKERKTSNDGPVLQGDYRFIKSEAWKALEGSNPVPLHELANRGQCRWPINEDHPHLFCALPTGAGSRYCATHAYLSHPRT